MRNKHNELDILIQAVNENGAKETDCVTIPRTLDGRLQVFYKKKYNKLIYIKQF